MAGIGDCYPEVALFEIGPGDNERIRRLSEDRTWARRPGPGYPGKVESCVGFSSFSASFSDLVNLRGEMQELTVTPDQIRDLIVRAQSGDRDAFDPLVIEFRARLESWIRSRIGERLRSRVDVEGIVQETYARAFESIRRFTWRHESSFFQWLSTIARHLIWNVSQQRSTDDLSLKLDPQASGVSPSKAMRRHERFERLERALEDLRPDEREVVRLYRIEGLKAREVAVRLGDPEPTVRSILARALKKLKDSMGDTGSLHLPDRELEVGGPEDD